MTGLAKSLVRYGYVPFMLLGLNAVAFYIVTTSASRWDYLWLLPLLVIAFLASHASERILPAYREWNDEKGDGKTNLTHVLVYEFNNVAGILMIPFVGWLFSVKPEGLLGIWPREWPVLAQLLLAIVLADLVFTLIHFISHRRHMLWRLHAVHHGVGRLYGLNGVVRHPLHQLLDMAIGTAPLAIAGMQMHIATLLGFAISVMLIVQHSNIAYALGPFRNHLSIGAIHHLHHVNWGKEGDCNFGLFFTIWDRFLGTFVAEPPRAIQAHDMGIDEVPQFPKSYSEQLAFPFRYRPGSGYASTPAGDARRETETLPA